MTEQELIRKSQEGDPHSFGQLIESHESRVYHIALKMLRNEHDAYDAAQEAFIKAFRHIKKFKAQSAFSTWLYRITTNVCLDFLKRNKDQQTISLEREIALEESEVSLQLEDETANTEEEVLKQERLNAIYQGMERLSPDHRQMIVLRDMEGFSYEEIATITNRNLGTVKSKINRARQALKEILLDQKELFFSLIVLLLTR